MGNWVGALYRASASGVAVLATSVLLGGVAAAAPAGDPQAPDAQNYPVMNAPGGAYFHGEPVDTTEGSEPGWGVYNGDTIEANCWLIGDPVGPYENTIWVLGKNVTRSRPGGQDNSGYINTHYVDDGQKANNAPELPHCGTK